MKINNINSSISLRSHAFLMKSPDTVVKVVLLFILLCSQKFEFYQFSILFSPSFGDIQNK